MIKPIGSSVGGSGSILAGLGIHINAKKNCLNSVYSHSALQKKLRKHVTGTSVIDSSAGLLSLKNVASTDGKPAVSWNSKVSSKASSISSLSNVENMKNMVAKKTSYAESDNSVIDEDMDDTMPQKTRT
ncbi:hypothetical protein G9A89_007432 [Geosiphon pyriformis]|nr:hypothetical protein G9A89_000468 [Geosiphon pyriformis]KAG9305029.1 hypothetical protein G9A89_007432 [Geosiphon pyriformis]